MAFLAERINTPLPDAELERRWHAVRTAMKEAGIDALVMQCNNDWMGGYVKYFTDLPATNGYPVSVVFPVDAPMTMISMGAFDQVVDMGPRGDGLRRGVGTWMTVPSFATSHLNAAYDAELAEKALTPYAGRTIGVLGQGQISAGFMDRLRSGKLSDSRFVNASDLVDQIKAIKSDTEISLVRDVATMQDAAMQAVLEAIRPGMRDIEVAAVAKQYALTHGSEQGIYLCASGALGTPTHFGNRHTQNRTIQEGDTFTLLIECNGPGGMYTEIGRTMVLGKASQQLKDEFAFAVEAQEHALTLLKPGTSGPEVWERHNDFMRANGRPPERRIFCHGMGYDMVERPLVRFDDPMKIEAGMNLACHPTWLGDHSFNWVCDNFLVGEQGVTERLHKTPQKIFELG